MALNIKRLLVSQPKPTSEKSPYFDLAEKYGVEIEFRPFIKVEPLTSKEFRQQKISILDYSAVVFTARTGIDHFFRLCEELRDRKSTRLNSSHSAKSRMPSSA